MAYGILLEVWGDYAAFNRPEMKVERVSYDVMTPSAARGVLEAIYWKPQMRWVVDAIHVLKPIRFTQVRRNELSGKIPVKGAFGVAAAMKSQSGTLGTDIGRGRQQRAARILRDVHYGIRAHIEVLDGDGSQAPEAKHLEMFKRRASKGQYFHHPYLGNREFPAFFRLVEDLPEPPAEAPESRDLGWMLHDIVYRDDPGGPIVETSRGRRVTAEPRFFEARLEEGVLHIPPLDSAEVVA
jgi:CRISPR-associated protein Cas5d